MIAPDNGLLSYTDRYLMARTVSAEYAAAVRSRVAAFAAWCECEPTIDALSCELVNDWLDSLACDGMSKWSLSGYRGALLAVWRSAFAAGDNHNPPLRVRMVRKPRLVVTAYTLNEIRILLAVAEQLQAIHSDGNRAADFWQSAIHVAYCCGPRRGDLLAITKSQVNEQGVLSFIQHKTGFPHRVQLSPAAIQLCQRLVGDKLLPWPYDIDWFTKRFKALRKRAGINRGSFKWIRRSAGSYAEKLQPGAGAKLLGHRDESVFRRYYNDETISGSQPIEPPPL